MSRPSQATILIDLAVGVQLFRDADGKGYATIDIGDHRENWPIRSKGFRDWLARMFYMAEQKAANASAIQDALMTIEGQARYDGPEHVVHLRIAEHDDAIIIDLCDRHWRAIEITANGWKLVKDAAVKFVRARGMQALPDPTCGDLSLLWQFANIHEPADRRLVLAWLLAAMRPTGPFPVLALQGEQGTAKSTLERLLRSLIDPSVVMLRTMPRDERDLMIAARNGWVIALDNLSGLAPWLSDGLCRLATGGGFGTRELYSDADELLIDVQRPVVLNGIDDIATRQDLIDRAIIVNLEPIPDMVRKPEAEFWREFHAARPAILGGLLDRVSRALRELPTTHLASLPRMADFALWASAAEPEDERGVFMAAYMSNRTSAIEAGLEGSPVATELRRLIDDHERWSGTATELLGALQSRAGESVTTMRSWPKSARTLSSQLRRLATGLRAVGVNVIFPAHHGRHKQIEIARIFASHASRASQAEQDQGVSWGRNGDAIAHLGRNGDATRDPASHCSADHRDARDAGDATLQAYSACPACSGEGCRHCGTGARAWTTPAYAVIRTPPGETPWHRRYPPNVTALDGGLLDAEEF